MRDTIWMRRKSLAAAYDISLRTVDYIVAGMRDSGRYDDRIISDGRLTIIDREAFEDALRHRTRRA